MPVDQSFPLIPVFQGPGERQAWELPFSVVGAQDMINPKAHVFPSLVVGSGWPLSTRSPPVLVPRIMQQIPRQAGQKEQCSSRFSTLLPRPCFGDEVLVPL